jgi:hypothetical protein
MKEKLEGVKDSAQHPVKGMLTVLVSSIAFLGVLMLLTAAVYFIMR